ncbi:MAG TPA: FMN-binding protein [Bryobacteraceae bacterium]|jgi:uncharacterized protein with FMN-binding domain
MAQGGSNKKVANGLVAMSCGAVLAVYTAGYVRTRSAVDQFEAQAAERRAADPVPQRIEAPGRRFRPKTPEVPQAALVPEASAPVKPKRGLESRFGLVTSEPEPAREESQILASQPAETPAPSAPVAPSTPAAPVTSFTIDPPPAPVAEHKIEKAEIAPALPNAPTWKDGTYLGWGTSRHGNIQAEVVIANGRIASATIAQCRTRYSCSVIDKLPPEVAQRQSPDVDYVSGATQSANAFYFAVVDALSRAK